MERIEGIGMSESEGMKENLLKIGLERYTGFQGTVYQQMMAENFNRLNQNVEIILSPENEEKIERFLADPEKESEIGDSLNRQNVDLASLMKRVEDGKERIEIIGKVLYKDESFIDAAKKQEQQGIEIEGFEEDVDFANLDNVLKNVFSGGLIDKALISKIVYRPDLVYVNVKGNHFYLPREKYDEWKNQSSEVQLFKFRAGNFSSWNKSLDLTPEYTSFSMGIFSFYDDDLSKFDYLNALPQDQRERVYKLGTVFHEVGHNLYQNLMGANDRLEWKNLIDRHGNLTYYSEKHARVYGNAVNYDEEFAEAVRLLVTVPKYLEKKYQEVYDFIKNKFPEINSL